MSFYLGNNYYYSIPDEEPRYRGFYDQEPQYPGDVQVKEFFRSEFKRVYPLERVNSKRANELWRTKKLDALNVLLSIYQKKLETYRAKQKKIDEENRVARLEWLDKIHERALFEVAVEVILEEGIFN